MNDVVSLSMQVTRTGDRYHGCVTRLADEVCVRFSGVLELVAALEWLTGTPDDPSPDDHGGAADRTEERHA